MENDKIKPLLKDVPKTMLIPLRARYLQTKDPDGIIHDPKSVEILDRIDYDFSGRNEVSRGSELGVCIRTEILDELTVQFLSQHDGAVVVNLGCGLDTRFHRLDNHRVTWFDLDVPEAIELRRNFNEETGRYRFISKSALDFSWVEKIPKGRPSLFIAEGLLMYFIKADVKSLLKIVGENFPNAEVILEAMSPFLAKRTKRHPDMKNYNAVFKWGIKKGSEIEDWHIGASLINEYYYFDRHKNKQPPLIRFFTLFPGFRKMMKIIHLGF